MDTIVDRQAKEEILNRGNTEVTPKREGHIMISYQWRDQKTLIDIRNQLHKQGHKVLTVKARKIMGQPMHSRKVIPY